MNCDNSPNIFQSKNYTYNAEKIIGSGTFGVVFLSSEKESGKKFAIKRVFQDKRYKNRELEIIRELKHPNCVRLYHSFYTKGENEKEVFLNIVMDYVPENIYKLTKFYKNNKESFSILQIKLFSFQILKSLSYIHSLGICHRDVKPQNLLVDPKNLALKLCDFGSAKRLIEGEQSIAYICSRFYRAPELIFGATTYSCKVDMWSAGCVIAEMIKLNILFAGENSLKQLVEIIQILGTPSKQDLIEMAIPNKDQFNLPEIEKKPLNKIFKPNTDKLAIDLISKLLVYSPSERLSAEEALKHPFFNDLKEDYLSDNISTSSSNELK